MYYAKLAKDDIHVKGNDSFDLTSKYHTELTHFTVDAKVHELTGFLQFFTAATVKHKNMLILLKSQNESNQDRVRKSPQNTYMK